MLKSKEHYDLMDNFDREFHELRLDKENKEAWSRGNIYQNGEVNELFLAYRRGYALGKTTERISTAPPSDSRTDTERLEQLVRWLRKCPSHSRDYEKLCNYANSLAPLGNSLLDVGWSSEDSAELDAAMLASSKGEKA